MHLTKGSSKSNSHSPNNSKANEGPLTKKLFDAPKEAKISILHHQRIGFSSTKASLRTNEDEEQDTSTEPWQQMQKRIEYDK